MTSTFQVGSIVQVPLHDIDPTKADGKNLTLVVVKVIQKKINLETCIVWHAKQGSLQHSTIQVT